MSPESPTLAVVDRDPGFVQVLSNRVRAVGWELRNLPAPATPEALVTMRCSAVVIDLAVIGPGSWEYLERVCSGLPGLAVIVHTGPSSVAQRVRGLRLGADAWVTKPCHPEELICVVQAAMRRHRRDQMPPLDDIVETGEITIRPDLYQAYTGSRSLEPTAREFAILSLLSKSERVMRREEIYERVWGYAMAHGDRSVDVFVRKLRQKLHAASPGWSYIHTHFGVGYRFAPAPADGREASRGAIAAGQNARRSDGADRQDARRSDGADRQDARQRDGADRQDARQRDGEDAGRADVALAAPARPERQPALSGR